MNATINGYIHKTTPTPNVEGTLKEEAERLYKSQDQGVYCEIVCPSNDRSYNHNN